MKLISIQYLRAIAILLVVYCHAIDTQMHFGVSLQQDFYYLQNFGAIGVDLFFVISGFIISYTTPLAVGAARAGQFVLRRFARINPSYYVASLFAILPAMLAKEPIFQPLLKSITILPIFDQGDDFQIPLILVGWTLSFEWFFYFIYASLILFSVKQRAWWLVAIIGSLSISSVFIQATDSRWLFVTNPLFWEFCFGVVIAASWKRFVFDRVTGAIFIGLGLLAFGLNIRFGYGELSEVNTILKGELCWNRVLQWGLPCAFIVMGLLCLETRLPSRNTISRCLLLIGDASFAIYLCHTLFFVALELLFRRLPQIPAFINPDLLVGLLTIAALPPGILYYRWIEKPLTRKAKLLLRTRGE